MKNRIISMLLTLSMLLGVFPVAAFAQETEDAHWATAAVNALNKIYGADTFTASDEPLTVAMVNAIVTAMGGTDTLAGQDELVTWGQACGLVVDTLDVRLILDDRGLMGYLYSHGVLDGIPEPENGGEYQETDGITQGQLAVAVKNLLDDGVNVTLNDIELVHKFIPTDQVNAIAGVSYDEVTRTLTLNNASLGSLRIYGPGALTIKLIGDSVIENDGSYLQEDGIPETPAMLGEADVTFTGNGSLSVYSTGESRTFVMDFGTLTFTDAIQLNVYEAKEAYGTFEIVSGGFRIDKEAEINVYGHINFTVNPMSPAMDKHVFAGGVVTGYGMTIGTQTELYAPEVIVEGDAVLNLTGELENRDGLEIRDGSVFRQTGGTITTTGAENCVGLRIDSNLNREDCTVSFLGGSIAINGSKGVSVQKSNVTVNGGTLSITGTNDTGISILDNSIFWLLDGIMTSSGVNRPAMDANQGGTIHLHGGKAVLTTTWDMPLVAEWGGILDMGEGMTVMDTDGYEVLPEEDGDSVFYTGTTIIISGEKSIGTYDCDITIPGGIVTLGAAFQVRSDILLGAQSGTVTFILPSDVLYSDGTMTVDSQTVAPVIDKSGNTLTVPLTRGGIVRFGATAGSSGVHILTAEIETETGVHTEVAQLQVEKFSLSLPSAVIRDTVPVSGTAYPGSVITFYEEGDGEPAVLGQIRATSLGTWRGEIALAEEREYRVYALIALPGGSTITTDTQSVTYAPLSDQVTTLTVTNYVHGRTALDEPVSETLVFDYETGENSRNFYSFWPDMPTFDFQVKFKKDASAVYMAEVVSTDRMSRETRVPLTYSPEEDTWVGQSDYDEYSLPYRYRVEFMLTQDLETMPDAGVTPDIGGYPTYPEITEEDAEIEDDDDGAFVIGGLDFTFDVSEDAKLTITDSAGGEVVYTETSADGVRTIDPAFAGDDLYEVLLTEGTFVDYEKDTLFILITGPSSGGGYTPVHVKYREEVEKVDDLPEEPELTKVYLLPDGSAWYFDPELGWDTAGLLDVYEELDFTPENLILKDAVFTPSEETIEKQVRESMLYTAFVEGVEAWAHSVEATTGAKIGLKLEAEGAKIEFTLTPTFTLSSDGRLQEKFEGALKITIDAERNGIKGNITLELKYQQDITVKFEHEIKGNKIQKFYSTADQSDSYTFDFSISSSLGLDDGAETKLVDFFESDDNVQWLTGLESIEKEIEREMEFGDLMIPTTIPGIFYFNRPGFGTGFGAAGSLTAKFALEKKCQYGYRMQVVDNEPVYETFSHEEEAKTTAQASFHAIARKEAFITLDMGVSLLKLCEVYLYMKGGLGFVAQGHGTVDFVKKDFKAELYASLYMLFELGLGSGIKLTSKIKKAVHLPILKMRLPLYAVGLRWMPTHFTTVEKNPLFVTGETTDLRKLVDLHLTSTDFKDQTLFGPPHEGTANNRIFPEDPEADVGYTFYIKDGEAPEGITLSTDGILTVAPGIEPGTAFSVRVMYTGYGDPYELYKTVPFIYSDDVITIRKTVLDSSDSRVATFHVQDLTTGFDMGEYTTSQSGVLNVAVPADHEFQVEEISCAPGLFTKTPVQIVASGGTVTFLNQPKVVLTTPDAPTNGGIDPSGFVYEGIQSNRLTGVTATLYYSDSVENPTENAAESQMWDAYAFQQITPQTTDSQGQYQWMVPAGWWQVKYEKDGYETAYSEWLSVPPVQTQVNIGLVSHASAALTVSVMEENGQSVLVLRFDRPVRLEDLTSGEQLQITLNGALLNGVLVPVDEGENDAGEMCVTTLTYHPTATEAITEDDLLTVTYESIRTYAGEESSGSAVCEGGVSAEAYTVMITGGGTGSTGAGIYRPDALVTIDAGTRAGYRFAGWTSTDVTLEQPDQARTTFVMPARSVTLTASWTRDTAGEDVEDEEDELVIPLYCILTFRTNGGTSVSRIARYAHAEVDLTPYTTVREGYRFTGWYADAALTEKITVVQLKKDTTVYAGWEKVEDTAE